MPETKPELLEKGDSKKAQKKEAKKAEKLAKKAEHKAVNPQSTQNDVTEGKKKLYWCNTCK